MKNLVLSLIFAFPMVLFGQKTEKTFTPGFIALNGASFGSAALDVALTQHCINENKCHEINTFMQGSETKRWIFAMGVSGVSSLASYELKKEGHAKAWIIFPMLNLGVHSLGVGFALRWQ